MTSFVAGGILNEPTWSSNYLGLEGPTDTRVQFIVVIGDSPNLSIVFAKPSILSVVLSSFFSFFFLVCQSP